MENAILLLLKKIYGYNSVVCIGESISLVSGAKKLLHSCPSTLKLIRERDGDLLIISNLI